MSSNVPDPTPSRTGGLLARLKGMIQGNKPPEPPPPPAPPAASPPEEVIPAWDPAVEAALGSAPVATPVTTEETPAVSEEPPLAVPAEPAEEVAEAIPAAVPVAAPVAAPAEEPIEEPVAELPEVEQPAEEPVAPEVSEAPPAEPAPPVVPPPLPAAPTVIECPVCGSPHSGNGASCSDCGYYFSTKDLEGAGSKAAPAAEAAPAAPAAASAPTALLQGRFQLGARVLERPGVVRFNGLDLGDGSGPPRPVSILRQEMPQLAAPVAEPVETSADDEILPAFDFPTPIHVEAQPAGPTWPSIAWEQNLLNQLAAEALPGVVAEFSEDLYEYLVEEVPVGQSLWDAWDDPDATSEQLFGLLIQVAVLLDHLHSAGVIVESIRPDILVVTPESQVRLTDLSGLLPLPLPADAGIRGTLYTAPELMSGSGKVDARADLYGFGAMLYALHIHRELTEKEFERPGHPKPFIPQWPDIHPAFGRLMTKTFQREIDARFPTDEAGREDATGFTELIRVLNVLRRTYDNVRLEVASWTTTGIVRTGNEDAFALLCAAESRQEDMHDTALVLLADGMGGYEAGEVAAALAIQQLRTYLTQQKMFAPLAGGTSFPADALNSFPRPEGHARPPLNVDECKKVLKAALKDVNKQVFQASRAPGSKRRGMGCTAEVVYIDNRNVVVGHVGDSRTYHLSEGRLVQLTRDQTLVNRLVELGTLSPEEAETHPRRNELQQAIGGQPDVEPGVYSAVLKPGDFIIVCSDGVTNHVTNKDLEQMLHGEGYSAETIARRLVNLTNLQGATDNATVVVVRAL